MDDMHDCARIFNKELNLRRLSLGSSPESKMIEQRIKSTVAAITTLIAAQASPRTPKDALSNFKNSKGFRDPTPPEKRGPHYLYRIDPWRVGIMTYGMMKQYQECGLLVTNKRGIVLCLGHLYLATRQERLIDTKWPDMDHLLEAHGSQQFFGGTQPEEANGYSQIFEKASGYTAPTDRKGKGRQRKPKAGETDLAPVCTFRSRFPLFCTTVLLTIHVP